MPTRIQRKPWKNSRYHTQLKISVTHFAICIRFPLGFKVFQCWMPDLAMLTQCPKSYSWFNVFLWSGEKEFVSRTNPVWRGVFGEDMTRMSEIIPVAYIANTWTCKLISLQTTILSKLEGCKLNTPPPPDHSCNFCGLIFFRKSN